MTLIWLGACLMAFGGALSLADRRLRFGAPARAKSAAAPRRGGMSDEALRVASSPLALIAGRDARSPCSPTR